MATPSLRWTAVTTKSTPVPRPLPAIESTKRWLAAQRAVTSLKERHSLLVSHGPHMTLYGAAAMRLRLRGQPHLAYAFNFTELPAGIRRQAMRAAFRQVDRFVCFSTMERQLYADHFGLDINRIDMIHWAVHPPQVDPTKPPIVGGDYICALGSQGRDYATLLAAMAQVPAIKLVVVAAPGSLDGLTVPSNVVVYCGIPFGDAMNILAHSRFNVVPLKGNHVPCGHVTIVAAMHSSKPTIVTDSLGVADYVVDGETGVSVEPANPRALANAIEALWNDSRRVSALSLKSKAFASQYCVESVVVNYFEKYLASIR